MQQDVVPIDLEATGRDSRRMLARLCLSVALVTTVALQGQEDRPAKPEPKPHIVVFISDDHGWWDSGCYGNSVVNTPHLDALAKQGMRFTMAFAEAPLCMPSRSSIHTGVIPLRNGAAEFGVPVKAGTKTLPDYMKELGYHTALIGKAHFKLAVGKSKLRKRTKASGLPYDDMNRAGGQQLKVSGKVGAAAAQYIAQYSQEKPLFLVVATYPPHLPWVKNRDYNPKTVDLPPSFVDTEVTRRERTMYYQDVTLMDSMLGEVRRALKTKKMDDDTVFIYTSDHGANWPFGKWCVYDAGLRVPFIVLWPEVTAEASTSDAILQLCDLTPTCIEIAGGKPPATLDGRSLVGVLRDEQEDHRDYAIGSHSKTSQGGLSNNSPARTIRSKRFRYVVNLNHGVRFHNHITGTKRGIWHLATWNSWVEKAQTDASARQRVEAYLHRPKEELFDMQSDPHSMSNLVGSETHKGVLADLRLQLRAACESMGDAAGLAAIPK